MTLRPLNERPEAPGSLAGALLPELEPTEENRRIDDIFAGVRGQWRLIIDEMRRNPLQCAVDSHRFYEFENLGRWECSQHAAGLARADATHTREYFPCCGREGAWAEGCVPADHRIHYAPYEPTPVLEMPQSVFDRVQKVFGPPKKTSSAHNRVAIDRFDREEAYRRARAARDSGRT